MATTAPKLADKPYAKLAIGATKAIALKLVEAVPVIGPYISVGAKAILDELEKLKQGGDEPTSKEVLTWMTNLSPADYETLVLEAIDLAVCGKTGKFELLPFRMELCAGGSVVWLGI
jgi:hypothetical protein